MKKIALLFFAFGIFTFASCPPKVLQEDIDNGLEVVDSSATYNPPISERKTLCDGPVFCEFRDTMRCIIPEEKGEASEALENLRNEILGSWEWESTSYVKRGAGSSSIRPDSILSCKILCFGPDKKVRVFKNGVHECTLCYHLFPGILGGEAYLWLGQSACRSELDDGPVIIKDGVLRINGGADDSGGNWVFNYLGRKRR